MALNCCIVSYALTPESLWALTGRAALQHGAWVRSCLGVLGAWPLSNLCADYGDDAAVVSRGLGCNFIMKLENMRLKT